jgi:hypothetical protein
VHFYNVRGLLIRRWVPAGRRMYPEVWVRDSWASFPDLDDLVRFGVRLTDSDARALLNESRRQAALPVLSEGEADIALRSRLRWSGAAVARR